MLLPTLLLLLFFSATEGDTYLLKFFYLFLINLHLHLTSLQGISLSHLHCTLIIISRHPFSTSSTHWWLWVLPVLRTKQVGHVCYPGCTFYKVYTSCVYRAYTKQPFTAVECKNSQLSCGKSLHGREIGNKLREILNFVSSHELIQSSQPRKKELWRQWEFPGDWLSQGKGGFLLIPSRHVNEW